MLFHWISRGDLADQFLRVDLDSLLFFGLLAQKRTWIILKRDQLLADARGLVSTTEFVFSLFAGTQVHAVGLKMVDLHDDLVILSFVGGIFERGL